jgi:hypothetical protein
VETATTVRYGVSENLITDGPYADTKEVFGGYFVFEASDLDEVLQVARRTPAVRLGGAVEHDAGQRCSSRRQEFARRSEDS